MSLDSLMPWRAPIAALVLALTWGFLFRRRPGLAGLGLPLGTALGFWLVLGIGLASPRQIFERLPGLAAGALLLAGPLALTQARAVQAICMAAAVVLGGWWLAGGPLHGDDVRRAATVWLAVSLAAAVLMLEMEGSWRGLAVAALLAALVGIGAPPGPWWLLALSVAAAGAGASVALPALPSSARMPLAVVAAALLAGPVLARGASLDWVAALGTLALAVLAPRLAGGARGWAALPAFAGVAAAALALAFALRG
jgi:hypothetical protein